MFATLIELTTMNDIKQCPNCAGSNIYRSVKGISGGGYAANYLPGLGKFMAYAKLYPVICGDCGLVRFFTDEETRTKLGMSSKWKKL